MIKFDVGSFLWKALMVALVIAILAATFVLINRSTKGMLTEAISRALSDLASSLVPEGKSGELDPTALYEYAKLVATLLPDFTPTPQPHENTLATVMAPLPTAVDNRGQALILSMGLKRYATSMIVNAEVLGKVRVLGAGIYCQPLVWAGTDKVVPGTEVGKFAYVQSSMYGSILKSSIEDDNNWQIIPTGERTVVTGSISEIVNSAAVTVTLTMGILETGQMPERDNIQTFQEVNGLVQAIFNPGSDVFRSQRDHVGNFANWLADWDAVAPLTISGQRSPIYLDMLYEVVKKNLTEPSANTNEPSAYDRLRLEAEDRAKEAGFEGISSFTVLLLKPHGVYGYTYVEDGSQVVPFDVDEKFKYNTCSNVPDAQFISSLPKELLAEIPAVILSELYGIQR